jgi:hypothetical protein
LGISLCGQSEKRNENRFLANEKTFSFFRAVDGKQQPAPGRSESDKKKQPPFVTLAGEYPIRWWFMSTLASQGGTAGQLLPIGIEAFI